LRYLINVFTEHLNTKKKENIVIIGPGKAFLSGVSYHTLYLSNALAKRAEVHAILIRRLLPKVLFPGRVRVGRALSSLELQLPSDKVYSSLDYNNPFTWAKALAKMWVQRPTAILVMWWTSAVSLFLVPMLICYKIFRRNIIVIDAQEVVDTGEYRSSLSKVGKLIGTILFQIADGIVVQSASYIKDIKHEYLVDSKKIAIIPEGSFDHLPIMSQQQAKEQIGLNNFDIILYFGLVRRYKGVPLLLDAFESLATTQIERKKLIIAGEIWEDHDYIVSRVGTSKYRNHILLIPRYLDDREVAMVFSAADVVVLPYNTASGSGVARLCMHFNKKVVHSNVPSLVEDFRGYERATSFRAGDVQDLAHKLVLLLNTKVEQPPKTRTFDDVAVDLLAFIDSVHNSKQKRDINH
jgi:glycosyltransferase involved in cell wall biosynthesis